MYHYRTVLPYNTFYQVSYDFRGWERNLCNCVYGGLKGFRTSTGSRVQAPLRSWIFRASIRNCKNCVPDCEDRSLLDFTSAAQYMKHFIYNFTNTFDLLLTSPVNVNSRPEALASVQCNVERVTNKKIIVKNTNDSCLSFCIHFLFVFPFAS